MPNMLADYLAYGLLDYLTWTTIDLAPAGRREFVLLGHIFLEQLNIMTRVVVTPVKPNWYLAFDE